ncbi:MAG: hypothetical protein ABIU07_03135, partial [Ramlibacter sp.]
MHQRFEIAFRAVAIAATATAGLALVACASAPENYGTAGMAGPQAFTLSSPAFRDGGNLETRHAGNLKTNPNCVGSNVSPALSWSNAPAGTRSLAFVVVDPDGRSGL